MNVDELSGICGCCAGCHWQSKSRGAQLWARKRFALARETRMFPSDKKLSEIEDQMMRELSDVRSQRINQ
jgi:hypothetical protein